MTHRLNSSPWIVVALAIAMVGACAPQTPAPSQPDGAATSAAQQLDPATQASPDSDSPMETATAADTQAGATRAGATPSAVGSPPIAATAGASPTAPRAAGQSDPGPAVAPGTPVSGGALGRVHRLREIRAGLHPGDRLRIVWEFATQTGLPLYEAGVEPDPDSPQLVVRLHDVNAMQLETDLPLPLPNGSGPLAIQPIPDDALLQFAAPLSGPYDMTVQELSDPARLVIDLVPRQ